MFCIWFCRVGLSAGTGLGVSSALVQNSNSDAANQDLVNNNPPAPVANQVAVNNPVVANQNADNNVDDDDDDMDIVEEEINDFDDNMPPPAEKAENDGSDNEKSAESGSDLVRCERCHAIKNADSNQAGPSGYRVQNCANCKCGHTSNTVCSCKNLCVGYKAEKDGKKNASDRRRSKRLQSTDAETSSYVGKGKSLRGSKKGIVKKSTNKMGSKVNQSCQASSEEIRETTKKAKEKEESTKPQTVTTRSQAASAEGQSKVVLHGDQSNTEAGSSGHESISSSTTGTGPATRGNSISVSGPATRGSSISKGGVKRKTNMVDQATSTSDPVIEEDTVQVSQGGGM